MKGERLDLGQLPHPPLKRRDIDLKGRRIEIELNPDKNIRTILLKRIPLGQDVLAKTFDRVMRLEYHTQRHKKDLLAINKLSYHKNYLMKIAILVGIKAENFSGGYFLYKQLYLQKVNELAPKL